MDRVSASDVLRLLEIGFGDLAAWEARWPETAADETMAIDPDRAEAVIRDLAARLADNYPFGHPSYAGQMLKPPHPVAAAAYALTQRINPNNHALDGGPATAKLEREAVAGIAAMFGYDPATTLAHLTSAGTTANLEALWIARSLHPDKGIAFSADAHYTHSRMSEVLGIEGVAIPSIPDGRMDLDALQAALDSGTIGTVVATAGTTSLGAVDAVDRIIPMAKVAGVRVHVDAAYGGYFTLLADIPADAPGALSPDVAAAFRAIRHADSIVVDPHKHGLQPYGCGAVLFRDASVGRYYKHDSPYTYFTSTELHLGEISLECSRAGAAAAALWATMQVLPLTADGMGRVLAKTRQAATAWADLIRAEPTLSLVIDPPSLDILGFYPFPANPTSSAITALTNQVFDRTMAGPDGGVFLAKLILTPAKLPNAAITWDTPTVTVLRSVLMKPEHLAWVPKLHAAVMAALG